MRSRLTWLALAAVAVGALALFALARDNPAAPAAPAGNERPAVAVETAAATIGDLSESIEVVGSLAPKLSADIKSEVSGTVSAVYVTEWVGVRKGAPLARLDTREVEAGIEVLKAAEAQARVGESRAKREYARAQQLKEYGLITAQNLDEATTAVEAAEAATRAAAAQIRTAEAHLQKSLIVAPFDGTVALRTVDVGDRVENMGGNEPMFRLVNDAVLSLTVTVPSLALPRVRVGQPVEFTTDGYPGRVFTGRVMFINPTVDEANRAGRITADVANPRHELKGGLFVSGRVIVDTKKAALQIPTDALQNWNVARGTADVFVVTGDKADKRPVTTGIVTGGVAQITSGVAAGDRVVTRGAFALRPGDRVTVAGRP